MDVPAAQSSAPKTKQSPAPSWRQTLVGIQDGLFSGDQERAQTALDELHEMLDTLRGEVFETRSASRETIAAFLDGALTLAGVVDEPEGARVWLDDAKRAAACFQEPIDRAESGAKEAATRAALLIRQGEFAPARAVVEEALELHALSRINRLWLLLTLVDLLRAAGEYDEAFERLAEAEAALLAVDGRGTTTQADMLLLRAQLYSDLGLPDQAANCCEEASPIAVNSYDPALQLSFLMLSSYLDLSTKRHARVVRELGAFLAQPEFLANAPGARAQLRIRLGAAQAALEGADSSRKKEAEDSLRSALRDPALPKDEQRIAETFLAELFLRAGRLDAAAEHLAAAEKHLQQQLAQAKPGERAVETALLAAYRSRLVAAEGADRERNAAQHECLRRACEELLTRRRKLPWRSGGVGFLHFNDARFVLGEFLSSAIRVAGETRGGEAGLEMLMRFQELGSLARTLGARAGSLAEVRALLASSGHGLLVYLPTVFSSHVLAIDREHLLCEELPSTDLLDPLIRELDELVRRSAAGLSAEERKREERAFERVRCGLADMLFPARVRELLESWKAVTIVGADLLDGLPFECLPISSPASRSLGMDRAVDLLPSLPVGLLLARRPPRSRVNESRPIDLWLVAAPAGTEESPLCVTGLPVLSLSAEERERLTSPYPEEAVRVFSGTQATKACLAQSELADARILQLLVHGTVDLTRERSAGLVLAPGPGDSGLLWCEELERLYLPPLVVLAACGAAHGPLRRGEDGLTNLGGAALSAGARCVVLARGDLELQATLRMLETFHKRLRAGDAPAEALRSARSELSSDPRWSHPFYHSLLQVVGLGQEPVYR